MDLCLAVAKSLGLPLRDSITQQIWGLYDVNFDENGNYNSNMKIYLCFCFQIIISNYNFKL